MLMLTLFSLYSYSVSHNRSDFNKDSRNSHETFLQHDRSAATNTSIDAIETNRERNWGVKECVHVCALCVFPHGSLAVCHCEGVCF